MKLIGHCRGLSLLLLVGVCALASVDALSQVRKPRPSRSITIVTEPSSTVWLDGVRYGVTDESGRLAIASVSPGVRSVRVRKNGFSEITKSLPAASRGDIAIKLTKTTDEAELAFQSAESFSTVDRQKAIAEYDRAIKLRPKFPEAYLGMARMLSDSGDIEKADRPFARQNV